MFFKVPNMLGYKYTRFSRWSHDLSSAVQFLVVKSGQCFTSQIRTSSIRVACSTQPRPTHPARMPSVWIGASSFVVSRSPQMAMRRSKGAFDKETSWYPFSLLFCALLSRTSLKDRFIISLFSKGNAEGLLEWTHSSGILVYLSLIPMKRRTHSYTHTHTHTHTRTHAHTHTHPAGRSIKLADDSCITRDWHWLITASFIRVT